MKLDTTDLAIIQTLQVNARLSIREIAKTIKCRPSTVHIRLQHLIKEKVIEKFTLKVNNKALGENFIVFILIKTNGEIKSAMLKDPRVKEVFGVTGDHDMILKLKCRDIEEFNSFLLNFRKDPAISSTVTMVSTATVKEEL